MPFPEIVTQTPRLPERQFITESRFGGVALSGDRLQPSKILKFPDHGVLVYCDTKACTEAVDLPWDDFSEIEEREKLRARFNDDALMLANVQ